MSVLRRSDGLYWHTMSGAPIYTPPASIDNTGATDVVSALSSFIADTPDDSVINLSTGTYLLNSGPLNIPSRNGLVIVGGTFSRTVERSNPSTNSPWPCLYFTSPTRCRVINTYFRGTNTTSDTTDPNTGSYDANKEDDAAVRADNFTDFLVSGLNIDGVWGDGVQLQNGDTARLLNYTINRCGRQGTTPTGTNVLVDGMTLQHGRRSGIDTEPDPSTIAIGGLEYRNCDITTWLLAFPNGGSTVSVDGLYIHDNTVRGSGVPFFDCVPSDTSRRSNYRFENNTVLVGASSPQAAIYVKQVDGVSIKNNTVPVDSGQSGLAVDLESCGGVCEITGNNFSPGGIYYHNSTPVAGQSLTVQAGLTLQ